MENALCVVGGIRTLGMPAVSEGLRNLKVVWRSDVLFDVHTKDDTSKSREHTQHLAPRSIMCKMQNVSEFLWSFAPIDVQIDHPNKCTSTYSKQREMVSRCFTKALQLRPYRWIARVRPDFFFPTYYMPQWSNPDICTIAGTNADILFVVGSRKSGDFIASLRALKCPKDKFDLQMIRKTSCRIHVEGGLVRTSRLLRIPDRINHKRLIAHMKENPDMFDCPHYGHNKSHLLKNRYAHEQREFRVFSNGRAPTAFETFKRKYGR
jgi:hypothetical protein